MTDSLFFCSKGRAKPLNLFVQYAGNPKTSNTAFTVLLKIHYMKIKKDFKNLTGINLLAF